MEEGRWFCILLLLCIFVPEISGLSHNENSLSVQTHEHKYMLVKNIAYSEKQTNKMPPSFLSSGAFVIVYEYLVALQERRERDLWNVCNTSFCTYVQAWREWQGETSSIVTWSPKDGSDQQNKKLLRIPRRYCRITGSLTLWLQLNYYTDLL